MSIMTKAVLDGSMVMGAEWIVLNVMALATGAEDGEEGWVRS